MENRFSKNYNLTLGFSIVIIYHSTFASTLIIMTTLFNPKALIPLSTSDPTLDESPGYYDNTEAYEPDEFVLHAGESTLVMAQSKARKNSTNVYSEPSPDHDIYPYQHNEQITSMSDILLLPSPPPLNK
ncbi:hypothetical protein [Parasitella parasitica]|uniref:Transmembrane protein n=1 Tax=Parasitella parasitica TaxID=35722 RepID=A0A0B7N4L7_9FUNG|nr:hypothetical protein [Parasitella parasitica]